MSLSSSDLAYMQARLNVGRLGAFRLGAFTPNVVLVINGTRLDHAIEKGSLRIRQALNDEPDTATFTLRPDAGFTPAVHQLVYVGLGDARPERAEFGGQVQSITHVYTGAGHERLRYQVSCVDFRRLFDRRLVTATYDEAPANEIIADIIETYTSGFTYLDNQGTLATVQTIEFVNTPPSVALRRIVTQINGGYYIDAARRVHAFGSGGETTTATQPVTLTRGLWSLEGFQRTIDASQVRTRSIVEGRSTRSLVRIEIGTNLNSLFGIPMAHDAYWFNLASNPNGNLARIGTQIIEYDKATYVLGPPAATLTADASPGDTTATVDDNSQFRDTNLGAPGYGWLTDGRGNVFACRANSGDSTLLDLIPSSGYGSIPVELTTGTPLYMLHALQDVTVQSSTTDPTSPIEIGDAIVVRAVADDSTAQTALAAIEGGDGVHEYATTHDAERYGGVQAFADADVEAFASALESYTWTTKDLNARPGKLQQINIAAPGAVSATVTILRSDVVWDHNDHLPYRTCEAGTEKRTGVLDAVIDTIYRID